jgi:hypothetical protein
LSKKFNSLSKKCIMPGDRAVAFDSPYERRVGIRDSTLRHDEGWVVDQRLSAP